MRDRRNGNALLVSLFLLIVLMAVGGYNYHRNWQAEQATEEHRPFLGYSDADLASLAEAYQLEIDSWEGRMARHGRAEIRDSGLLAERVAEFERVRERSARHRDLTTEVADREARIRGIRAEQKQRAGRPTGMALHVARLTSL